MAGSSIEEPKGGGVSERWLPPELRRRVAIVSHPGALAQLCLVNHQWNAECEPVLYERIGVFLGLSQKQLDRTASWMGTILRSSYKASLVRTLLVHFSRGQGVEESVMRPTTSLAKRLFAADFLPRLVNLIDLRIRNDDLAAWVSEGLADVLGSETAVVKLRNLHIPQAYANYPDDMARILRALRGTLHTLGVQTAWKSEDWTWPLRTGLLDEGNGCAVFGFSNNVYDAPFDWLALRDTRHIAAVAQTLRKDQSIIIPRPIPWYYGFFVVAIDLRRHGIPTPDAVQGLAQSFPHVAYLDLAVSRFPDPGALAATLAPLKSLQNLSLALAEDASYPPELDDVQRVALASAVASGCKKLTHLTFPDKSIRCKSEEDDSWFDPDAAGSDEEDEDEESDD